MTDLVRESVVVGRLGGDEFAVLLHEATGAQAIRRAGDLGVAAIGATTELDSSELLGRADGAMYRAKRAGGGRVASAESAVALSA